MGGHCTVDIKEFAKTHFIKRFEKKYKSHWEITLRAIIQELERVDNLLLTSRAETICDSGEVKIIKTQFAVAKSRESAKTSGNRCIVAWHPDKQLVAILLLYGKTDLGSANETAEWKKIVKNNYPQYRDIL